jgi:hypothetical protein
LDFNINGPTFLVIIRPILGVEWFYPDLAASYSSCSHKSETYEVTQNLKKDPEFENLSKRSVKNAILVMNQPLLSHCHALVQFSFDLCSTGFYDISPEDICLEDMIAETFAQRYEPERLPPGGHMSEIYLPGGY